MSQLHHPIRKDPSVSSSDTALPTTNHFPAERVLASYGEGMPFSTYNLQLDGAGGIRLMIEVFGVVYEVSGRTMTPYRIIKRRPNQADETILEGVTTGSRAQARQWVPKDNGLDWSSDDGTEYTIIYMMAAGDGWEEMSSYEITP